MNKPQGIKTEEVKAGTAGTTNGETLGIKDRIVGKIAGKLIDAFTGIKAMSTNTVMGVDIDVTAKDCSEKGTTVTTVTPPTEGNTATVTKIEKDSTFSGNIVINIKYNIKGDYTIGR